VFRAYQLAKNDYSITENKHRLTKPCPPSMRASNSLELPETSMVKKLHNKSSNGLDNSANGFRTSKNPYMGFYDTSIGQKMKKIGLLPFSSFKLAETGSPKCTLVCLNQEHAPNSCLNLAPACNRITVQTVGWLGCLQPLTA
jgi:hypothetical protein